MGGPIALGVDAVALEVEGKKRRSGRVQLVHRGSSGYTGGAERRRQSCQLARMVAARRSEIRAFVLQADNQIISRFDAISMLSVDAVLVLANPSAAGRTASHDQRYLPDAVRGFHRDHLLSVFG